ncbi:MAG: aldo/keto reductase [Gammaproteobacteria bacterium]
MTDQPNPERYSSMSFRRAGLSGLKLPELSLGLWHNFGDSADPRTVRSLCRTAFDHGITYFDLANNYGPPPGSAETSFGRILKSDFYAHRDELVIASKAGYGMWPGPYGDGGSRKYMMSSLDQSLRRLGLDYVDIYYSHRYDPDTPLEETMGALASTVQQGKALYAGVSNYPAGKTAEAARLLKELGTPCIVHQPCYSIFNRHIEQEQLLDTNEQHGIGTVVYSPLSQGLLTNRYLTEVPQDSRAATSEFLNSTHLTAERLSQIHALNNLAAERGQTLAQMALSWVLRDQRVTSAIVGASHTEQLLDSLKAVGSEPFTHEELARIDDISP